jgi:formylglycine-generating enzyme required for sulfatase activity
MTRCTIHITVLGLLASTALAAQVPKEESHTNSIGMKLVRIEAGAFDMGFGDKRLPDELVTKKSHFAAGDFDEQPTHRVRITKPFYMAECEVTNAQYEQFDPSHKEQRGRNGYSKADDEAVVFVNWHDAVAFCKWLSEKEGLPYRLPTEAEWEYACRAGTTTAFYTGNTLPTKFSKEADEPLTVAKTPPNPWGLYDMHGNVEEWCYDWYGPYESEEQTDPLGRADGDFKVTRGGSHSTEPYYLRSSNRLGCHPDDKQYMIGFRVVLGEMPTTKRLPTVPPQRYQRNVRQDIPRDVTKGPDPDKPYFKGPRPFVRIPQGSRGPLFSEHNHFGAVTACPNGDLLAACFTCEEEMGRELGVAVSRLRYGHEEWEPSSPFWDAPDRNDHTHTLWYDGKGNIWHFNGLAIKYRRLALLLRRSRDNGATWSKARIILDHNDTRPNKVHESVFRAQAGQIIVPFDGPGGSVLAISPDEGRTWFDPGGSIRGTHGGVLQLADGRLMGFGRHGAIEGKMPMSISADMGKTWTYEPSPFQSIHTGRRLALMRLKEGQLFIAAFCNQMMITDISGAQRPITGLSAALSTDEGKTWPYRRLVSDDGPRREVGTMDGDPIIMDASNSEPVGYLAVCQSADGIINLVSSYQHYAFNTKWLMTAPPTAPPPPPPPAFKMIPLKADLPNVYEPKGLPSKDKWRWSFSSRHFNESDVVSMAGDGLLKIHTNDQQQFWLRTEKKEIFGPVNPKKGFTAEIKTHVLKRSPDQRGVDFELYDGAGSRYAITITDTAVYWYQGTVMSSALLPFSQYVPLAENMDNTDAMHTYRIAVREDRVAQVYRDGRLLGTKPVEYRTPRSPYIYFGAGPGLEALVEYVSYDLDGPSRP